MAELDITNAFNDCIDYLAQGQTIEDCLRRYPQYAATLRSMLEAGLLVQKMRDQPAEVTAAQNRVRRRFEDSLRAPLPKRSSSARQFVYALAALLIIAFISVGSLTAISQNSLPGDSLYSVKTFSEGLQKSLFDNDALETNFDQRRINEIQQLLVFGRAEEVSFRGIIESQNGSNWIIDELPITVQPDISNISLIHIGDKVDVTAHTTELQSLIATSIQIIQPASTPIPTVIIPTQSPTATISPTQTPTQTATPNTPTITPVPPTSTLAHTIISIPQVTTLTVTACVPTKPDGWVSYQIRFGNTLSALAGNTDITLTELMTVNCITDAGRIIVGETVYLPRTPTISPIATANSNQSSGSNNSGINNSGSGNSNPSNSNPTEDHSGDDHGGGGNSGPGGGGSGGGNDDGSGHT